MPLRCRLCTTNDCVGMKALSLTQPWAELVVLGEKQWETRSWRTSHRSRIAIHAAKKFLGWAKALTEEDPYFVTALGKYPITRVARGAIVGTVEILEMQPTDELRDFLGRKEIAFGDYQSERWGWKLANPVRLLEPIPCRGMLGLWEVPPEIVIKLADLS